MNSPSKIKGFSLIELMIGITLGLLVVTAVGTIFANNYRTRSETEKTNLQIENGRYATQLLTDEMHMAGYYGELDPTSVATPAALPDPCDTTTATLISAVALPVQGVDNAAAVPACLADVKTGTDIFVDRRASSCIQGTAGCAAGGYEFFQTALCSTSASQYLISANTGSLNLTAKDCATTADIRSYRTNIYFVANNNQPGDGIPTLKVAELGSAGFTITPLVAGIDQFQIEYGIDTNGDSIPDAYTSDPGSYGGCTGVGCQTNWRNVVTARLYILARNTQPSGGFSDTHVYTAGGNTYGPYNDAYKRHLYTSLVRFNNVAGRLE
jgi:type IV pilus assembly protein PilW